MIQISQIKETVFIIEQGVQIGFDGSQLVGNEEIFSHLKPIFADHTTPMFITKIKSIRSLGDDVDILHAIVGMIPSGQTEINPDLYAHQTLVVVRRHDSLQIELFQNTPAQYHGRPELVVQMTNELRELLKK